MNTKILILGLVCFLSCCTSPADPEIKKVLNSEPANPEVLPQAVLEVTTIPEILIFTFVPSPDWDETKAYSWSEFTLVTTETKGVGGHVRIRLQWGSYYPGTFYTVEGRFEPFSILSFEINLRIYSASTISYLKVWVDGTDDNGYSFDFIITISTTEE